MSQKYLDLAGLTAYDGKIKQWFKAGLVDITDEQIRALFPVVQPDNEIWYTSRDGNIVDFYDTCCNTTLVSNTYEDGKGVAKFKDPLTYISSEDVRFVPSQDYGRGFIGGGSGLLTLSLPNSLQRIETASLFDFVYFDSGASGALSINLNELTLGSGLESIYKYPGFGNIDKVNFKGSLTDWLNIGFNYSEELPDIYFEDGPVNDINPISNLFYIQDELFTDLIVPDSITELKPYVFNECKSLKSITLHDNVQTIGDRAFEGCTGLTSLDLSNAQTIGNSAFERCTSLTSLDLGNVQTIDGYAFRGCTGLTSLDLGNVQTIGNSAFEECTGLTSITIPSTVTSISSNAFKGAYIQSSNFVNNSSLDAEANNYWGAVVYDNITEDGLIIKGTKITGYNGGSGTGDSPKYIEIPKTTTSISSRAIVGANNIYLTYDGTEEEWNAIEKGGYEYESSYWCYGSTSPGKDFELIIKLKDKDIELWSAGI